MTIERKAFRLIATDGFYSPLIYDCVLCEYLYQITCEKDYSEVF